MVLGAKAGGESVHVVIDARLHGDGTAGGVEQALASLTRALGDLRGNGLRQTFVVRGDAPNWLSDHLRPHQSVIAPCGATAFRRSRLARLVDALYARVPGTARTRIRHALGRPPTWAIGADPQIERLRPDVVHFPYQTFGLTRAPAIFEPWDLLHEHHPELLAPESIEHRRRLYAAAATRAAAVVAHSDWARRDFLEHLPVEPRRVYVVPLGAATEGYAPLSPSRIEEIRRTLRLPERFAVYPAQTWPHKNHVRLLEAWADVVRACENPLHLVCTGYRNPGHWPTIERTTRRLGLSEHVHFLGFLPRHEDVQALYSLAELLVFPSLFEGWGLPILEAFRQDLPVACSTAAGLPELVGDAAATFDPASPEAIARSVIALASDELRRRALAEAGRQRLTRFSWRSAAERYSVLYRHLAGRPLDHAEAALIRGMSRA